MVMLSSQTGGCDGVFMNSRMGGGHGSAVFTNGRS